MFGQVKFMMFRFGSALMGRIRPTLGANRVSADAVAGYLEGSVSAGGTVGAAAPFAASVRATLAVADVGGEVLS